MVELDKLECFINEGLRLGAAQGYHPAVFIQMRERWGTKGAMMQLVKSGDIQSGFRKMQDLGLIAWSVEAGVVKFHTLFSSEVRAAAQFRLDQLKAGET